MSLLPNAEDIPKKPKIRRVIRVGPWRNKEEFATVYKCLYGENANYETKQQACKRMLIWKMRRSNLTPAAILSTLVMIEMQLKDYKAQISKNLSEGDLRIMYSSSFTRFINYMSSILQTRNLKTMYATAKELGLGSFLIDLRHLCAHGQTMPDIDLFRRTISYCVKWLKEYYWDHELKYMENVDAKDIRRVGRNIFDEEINELFITYDAISEGLIRNCIRLQRAKKCLAPNVYIILKRFSNINDERDLKQLLRICVKKLSELVKRQDILRGGSQVYLEALMSMNFFFESAAYRTTSRDELALLIDIHQPLFQAMAISGFIEALFHRLIIVAENEYETVVRRKGASFWAHQIVKGFIAFRKFKFKYKKILARKPEKEARLSTINALTIPKRILRVYRILKVDTNTTLIFGDSIQNPWSLHFKREYIKARIVKINEFTIDVIKDCLQLVIPQLKRNEKISLIELIEVHSGGFNAFNDSETEEGDEEKEERLSKNKLNQIINEQEIYTLSHVIGSSSDVEMNDVQEDDSKKIGIWTRVSTSQDWSRCPIGRLIWE